MIGRFYDFKTFSHRAIAIKPYFRQTLCFLENMAAPMAIKSDLCQQFRVLSQGQLWFSRYRNVDLYCARKYSSGGNKKSSATSSSFDIDKLLDKKSRPLPPQPRKTRVDPHGRLPSTSSITNIQPKRFKEVIHQHYQEAKRSVFVRTNNPKATLHALNAFGSVNTAFSSSHEKQYILAEYKNESSVFRLLDSAHFFTEENQFPIRSRCLFDNKTMLGNMSRQSKKYLPPVREDCWHNSSMTDYPLADTLDEELEALCASRSLNDLDLRMRFLVCFILEDALQSLLPDSRVIPYGSCLNGFGWWNSDLDMMLCLNGGPFDGKTITTPQRQSWAHQFKFFTEIFNSERNLAQMTLTLVAAMLRVTPKVFQVFKILNARVPIVRFCHSVPQLQCDVSLEAMDSIKMTELLYLLSSSDHRLRPLMCGIKQWALCHKLTSSGEQQKPTTIGLLSLFIFYLQQVAPPVLPTLRDLQNSASQEGVFSIGSVVYAFPSHPGHFPKSRNKDSLEALLHGFFAFYSDFDFSTKAISLIEGQTFPKPANSEPIYVENPLSIGLNICKNVNEQSLYSLQEMMRVSAKKIEELSAQSVQEESRLSALFTPVINSNDSLSVGISELFDDLVAEKNGDENNESDHRHKADDETLAAPDIDSILGNGSDVKNSDVQMDVKRHREASDIEHSQTGSMQQNGLSRGSSIDSPPTEKASKANRSVVVERMTSSEAANKR